MTAYGAVLSLKNTIDYILHSFHFALVEPTLHIIQPADKELKPLQEILERLDDTSPSRSRKKVNALDGRIKDLIWKFEDLLKSLLLDQILSQLYEAGEESQASSSRSIGSEKDVLLFSIDLQSLRDDVGSFIKKLKDMEKEYIYEVDNMDQDDEAISSIIGFSGTNSKMIGLSNQFEKMKHDIIQECDMYRGNIKVHLYAVGGTACVGKTTLAQQIYQDSQILSRFDCRARVVVGRKPQLTQISLGIQDQLFGDEKIGEWRLEGKKCLIVLDDVWEDQILVYVLSCLPKMRNGMVKVLVIALDPKVITTDLSPYLYSVHHIVVRFLDEEGSKDLLCHKVFGDETCPSQLDKAATKIAKNCEGLPLTIVTVAVILSKSENRDPKYWDEVAEERNSVFKDAYDEISKVLFPSYDYLPQDLKMPFLYLGVSPKDYNFSLSKLTNMLKAEGWFLDTNQKQSLEVSVSQWLYELCVHRNLVLFNTKSIFWNQDLDDVNWIIKTCRLHSSWRNVCRKEARKNKFCYVLDRLGDNFEESVKGQRCLSLQINMLFGIKEFCNSVRLNCASFTRSLLFFGPYQQYPTPIDVGFRLLRELDALKLRFYSFPIEILILVQLKYLALTCNGELPTTISKLFNLQVLIIHPHMSIRCCRATSNVLIQIWEMQELEHIEILGKSLVAPHRVASMKKLSTLVGVNASICTILELSRRIPNIRKFGVQIESTPYDDHNALLSCFRCISTLENLVILKCSITNPVLKHGYVFPVIPWSLKLPWKLKKLHLSGMGFPWQYMDAIGSLPCLEVLKLRSYAFQGSKWETQSTSFYNLRFLVIEDSDFGTMGSRI